MLLLCPHADRLAGDICLIYGVCCFSSLDVLHFVCDFLTDDTVSLVVCNASIM